MRFLIVFFTEYCLVADPLQNTKYKKSHYYNYNTFNSEEKRSSKNT